MITFGTLIVTNQEVLIVELPPQDLSIVDRILSTLGDQCVQLLIVSSFQAKTRIGDMSLRVDFTVYRVEIFAARDARRLKKWESGSIGMILAKRLPGETSLKLGSGIPTMAKPASSRNSDTAL